MSTATQTPSAGALKASEALSRICDITFMCAVNGDAERPLMPSREEIVKIYETARLASDAEAAKPAVAGLVNELRNLEILAVDEIRAGRGAGILASRLATIRALIAKHGGAS